MTLKIKIIMAAITILIIVTTIICLFVYINSLNNKISDLNVVIAEQNSQIAALNCQIESLEKNVKSFHETLNITNDHIKNIERARQEEINVKQEIYKTTIEDPATKEWYDKRLPDSLIQLLLKNSEDIMCN